MSPLALGIEVAAVTAVVLIFGAVIGTIVAFIKAQTTLISAAFVKNKCPHAHLHPYTQSLLDGTCPDLKEAQRALRSGYVEVARDIVSDICFLLDAEKDKSMREQLKSKLQKAVASARRDAPQRERRAVAVQRHTKRPRKASQLVIDV